MKSVKKRGKVLTGTKRGSIKTKIVAITLAMVIFALVVSNIISASISTKAGQVTVESEMKSTAHSIAAQVSEYVNKAYGITQTAASTSDIQSADMAVQQALVNKVAKDNPFFILVYNQNANGDQTARDNGDLGNRADRWWFIKAMQDKTAFVSKSYFSLSGNVAVTSIVCPVFDAANNISYVFATDLSLEKLQEIVNAYNTETRYSIIIDGEGNVIAHPNSESVSKMHNYLKGTYVEGEAEQQLTLPPELTEISTQALSGESGVREFSDENGVPCIYSYEPIQLPGESDPWAVITVEQHAAAFATTTNMIKTNIAFMVGTIVVAIFLVLAFASRLTNPLKKLTHAATQIGSGDLDVALEVRSKDEIGEVADALRQTVDQLKKYMGYINEVTSVMQAVAHGNLAFELQQDYAGQFAPIKVAMNDLATALSQTMLSIKQASGEVATGSDQVASGAQALSQGAAEQASSVEELSAAIMQISSQIEANAKTAEHANQLAQDVGQGITDSNEHMHDMITAMQEIREKSNEIGKIIKTIDDIAFQTNILALNAAVEAARAGTAGKGFAVVADEVRNLAQKSAEAAKVTTSLIEGTVQAVLNGTKIADETAQSLVTVVESTRQVSSMVDEITVASRQQAEGANQISIGVEQISAVVQTTSATAEESAATSEELSAQAEMLRSLVNQFHLKQD